MRGVFVTTNSEGADVAALAAACNAGFDKVAVQDELPYAQELLSLLRKGSKPMLTSIWTAHPDDTVRLLAYQPSQIILQAEDEQADAVVVNIVALRETGFQGLISIVSNMWPSRNVPWFDRFMHKNNVRLLVECYLPDNANLTVSAMTTEGIKRGYPNCEPVLGCYRGFDLAQYTPLPSHYWIWDAAQMAEADWAR